MSTTTITTKATEAGPVLVIDGEDVEPSASVTWQASAWAAVLDAYHQTAVTSAVASVEKALQAEWPSIVERIASSKASPVAHLQIDGLREAVAEAIATTVQTVRVESMPVRLETRRVTRDNRGQITETRAVTEDVA